ncbi:DUF6258 family protein [Hafnia paralvei]
MDSWDSAVRIKINLISRLPIGSDEWLFYDKENLESGYLVFSEVFYNHQNISWFLYLPLIREWGYITRYNIYRPYRICIT